MALPAPFTLPHKPRQVLLFSGHMIDSPDRAEPRFPASMEHAAARRIEDALNSLGAGASDIALTQGAAGGDLLFAEACVRRGVPLQLLLPLPEAQFIEQSILPSVDGERWRQRFLALKASLAWPPQVLEPGDSASDGDPFELCNMWLLATALACGADTLRLICLWNGNGGDAPGGTAHMVREVERRKGEVIWIDTRTLQ
ncbi:hypothetical protein [Piscinibacter sp.]|jgi:hypothetical protein|uniref:hypothetical protein n=1 Tax=Piscinibacter sp. TaxID=1903157 RepID=UPI0035599863